MIANENVLMFTEPARSWRERKAGSKHEELAEQLRQRGHTVYVNQYALAFHNWQHPLVLIGGASFLKAWSLPNPAILVPQIDAAGQIDFVRNDLLRVQRIFLPATQIDYLIDERVQVGSVDSPRFVDALLAVLQPTTSTAVG